MRARVFRNLATTLDRPTLSGVNRLSFDPRRDRALLLRSSLVHFSLPSDHRLRSPPLSAHPNPSILPPPKISLLHRYCNFPRLALRFLSLNPFTAANVIRKKYLLLTSHSRRLSTFGKSHDFRMFIFQPGQGI